MEDNWLVVILSIVLMVAGSLGQLKKKKPMVTQPEGKKPEPEIWETLFGESEEPAIEPQEYIEIAPESEGNMNPEVAVPEYRFENEEGKSFLYKKDSTPDEPEHPLNEASYMDDFSLQRAVVYSEILNPKYF